MLKTEQSFLQVHNLVYILKNKLFIWFLTLILSSLSLVVAAWGFHRFSPVESPKSLDCFVFLSNFWIIHLLEKLRSKTIGDFAVSLPSGWVSVWFLLFLWFYFGSILGRILRSKTIGDFVVFLLCLKRVDFQSDFSCFCGSAQI